MAFSRQILFEIKCFLKTWTQIIISQVAGCMYDNVKKRTDCGQAFQRLELTNLGRLQRDNEYEILL